MAYTYNRTYRRRYGMGSRTTRRNRFAATASGAVRGALLPAHRGFLRTGGYFGRYNRPRSAYDGRPSEMKFLDTAVSATDIPTAGVIISNCLNVVPQDATESGRIGRKITIKQIMMHSNVAHPSVAIASCANRVRFILYLDKQANGAASAVNDILETTSIHAFRVLANAARYTILADRKVDLNPGAGGDTTAGQYYRSLDIYKKCNIVIEYDNSATTGALTTVRSNNIGLLAIANDADGTDFSGVVRIRYTDS